MTAKPAELDLDDPAGSMRAFMKARASLDGEDAVTWFAGNVHAWMPGGRHTHVFGFEGYNVARAVEVDGGFDLLTCEAVFYLDPNTSEILERWKNPFTDEEVDVVHVWNRPVNQPLRLDGPRGPWVLPVTRMDGDVYFNMDIFLGYPSPLSREQFPDNSQDDLYQAVELFQFYCTEAEIQDPATASAPARVSWTRIAPWLPFMRMGATPGQLVYHCRGMKLANGFAGLPAHIQDYVMANGPEFRSAPTEFTQPNETSWTYFRKLTEGATTRS